MSQYIKFYDGTVLPDIETLSGNSGGAVGPSGGNINVVGDGTTIDIVGNPGTSTLTASFIGSTDITITGDTGGAQTGDSFTFDGGTTGLSFDGAANVFTTTFAGITANGGTVSLATDATASTVNIGSGAGAKTVQLGSTNTTSSLALRYGTSDFTLASATGTVMNALDTGEITYPLQPAFLAILSGTRSNVTGNGTNYVINLGLEIFDQGGDFNGTTTFTAPVSGKYRFDVGTSYSDLPATATTLRASINTSNRRFDYRLCNPGPIITSTQYNVSGSVLCEMDAADTANIETIVSGTTLTVDIIDGGPLGPRTWFSGSLVC